MTKTVKVTLVKGLIGTRESHRATVRGLGLRRVNSVSELQLLLNEGKVTEQTIVFNPLVENLTDLKLNFEVNLKDTWLNRFVNNQKHENS